MLNCGCSHKSIEDLTCIVLSSDQNCRFTPRQPSTRCHVDNSVEMTRALCYGGTVADKRPIFQPIIMWVAVILSALLHVSPEKTEQSYVYCMCVYVSVCRIFPLTLSDRGVWCFVVLQCVGCGHHVLVKVISFSPNVSPHIHCPQHVSVSRVRLLGLRGRTVLSSLGLLLGCLFIYQLCLKLCGCVRSEGLSSFLHPSLTLSFAHPLSVCWHGPRLFWALALGALCICVTFAIPLPAVLCYR